MPTQNENPAEQQQTPPVQPADQSPPTQAEADELHLDGELDPERIKRLVAALREDKRRAQERAEQAAREAAEFRTKVEAFEAEKLTETERLARERDALKQELIEARRERILAAHKLPDSARLFLTGETQDELEAQAAALEALRPAEPDPEESGQEPDITADVRPNLVPRPQIPLPPEPFDPVAIARRARGRR